MSTDPIIDDLLRKCEDDVSDVIMRTAKLSPTQLGAATISLGAAAVALGVAAGAVAANCDESPAPEEAADALWERLRPMVVRAFEAISA